MFVFELSILTVIIMHYVSSKLRDDNVSLNADPSDSALQQTISW